MATKSGGGRRFAGIAAGLFLAAAGTARAQTLTTTPPIVAAGTSHLIEWDLATLPDAIDANPGAMVVDTRGEDHNQLWFVTRVAAPDATVGGQRVYRFAPPRSLMKADAQWTSWDLRIDTFAGGVKKIRPSHDRRYIFVRTATFIQRIDTQNCTTSTSPTCQRTVWTFEETPIEPTFVSDIAVDDQNRVFTTGVSSAFPDGYVQMLIPGSTTVKRWLPGTAPGACVSQGTSFSCISGIDIHPQSNKQNLIYYTEPNTNTIAELNINITNPSTSTPNIRRWSLAKLSAATHETITQPRMLKIDRSGKIWVNTGSGHLVSLDPSSNKMTKHQIPAGAANDAWGIAPDSDVVGYTAADTNKVAMLFPKFPPVVITPDPGVAPFTTFPTVANPEASSVAKGPVTGIPKVVDTTTTRKDDGTYVEAMINTNGNDSLQPLGISANFDKAQGTFFYTVGLAAGADPTVDGPSVAKRIGFARLPVKERIRNPRDDDDADDGFDRTKKANWHNSEPGDDDADGVPDQYDTNSTTDNTTMTDPTIVPVGQSWNYPMSTSATTLALIAAVTPDVATATIAVDVYNAIGTLVGTSGPVIGAGVATIPTPGAGTYTIRVRNLGTSSVSPSSTTVVREPLIQQ
jgi:hypothetical protein